MAQTAAPTTDSLLSWIQDDEPKQLNALLASPVLVGTTLFALFHSKMLLLGLQKAGGFRFFSYAACSLELLFLEAFCSATALWLHWYIVPVNHVKISLISLHVMGTFLTATMCMLSQGQLPFSFYMSVLQPGYSSGTIAALLCFVIQAGTFYAHCVGLALNMNSNIVMLLVPSTLVLYRMKVEGLCIARGVSIHKLAVAQAEAHAKRKAAAKQQEPKEGKSITKTNVNAKEGEGKSTTKANASVNVPEKLAGNPGSALKTNIAVKGSNSYYYAHASTKEEQITQGGAPQRIVSPTSAAAAAARNTASLKAITNYAVDDTKKSVKLYLARDLVNSDIPEGELHCNGEEHVLEWSERSCRVQLGKSVLDVKPLHADINNVRVEVKSSKVVVVMTKVEPATWPTLRAK